MTNLTDLYTFRTIIGGDIKTHENRYRATKYAMSRVRQGADGSEENIKFEAKIDGEWKPDHQAAALFAHKYSEYLSEPKTEKAQAAPKQVTVQSSLRNLSKAAQLLAARPTITDEEWSTLAQAVEDVMSFRQAAPAPVAAASNSKKK